MALDQNQLQQKILQTLQAAANAADIGASQKQLAQGLAQAIHQYVSAAAVQGIQIDLTKGNPASQTADGKLS
jgi:hypothetical protein